MPNHFLTIEVPSLFIAERIDKEEIAFSCARSWECYKTIVHHHLEKDNCFTSDWRTLRLTEHVRYFLATIVAMNRGTNPQANHATEFNAKRFSQIAKQVLFLRSRVAKLVVTMNVLEMHSITPSTGRSKGHRHKTWRRTQNPELVTEFKEMTKQQLQAYKS